MIRSLGAVLLAAAAFGAAADFPDRPVRIVVGFAPGGSDISVRILGPKLTELWKQPVVIENRAGAGGVLGTDAVAKAPADGYTIDRKSVV